MKLKIDPALTGFGLITTIGLLSVGKPVLSNPACYVIFEDEDIVNLEEMCRQPESPNIVVGEVSLSPAEELYFRGDDQFLEGSFEESIESLTAAIKLEPDNERYYFARALSYTELGDIDAAKADYEAIKNIYIQRGEGHPDRLEYIQSLIEMI